MSGTITVTRTSAIVSITVGVLVLVLVLTTVASKRWWARRIGQRWTEMHRIPSEWSSTGYEYEKRAPNIDNWTLAQLIRAYYKGAMNWQRRDTSAAA